MSASKYAPWGRAANQERGVKKKDRKYNRVNGLDGCAFSFQPIDLQAEREKRQNDAGGVMHARPTGRQGAGH
jgi:hypothetical protein